jgi:hypothetical protein
MRRTISNTRSFFSRAAVVAAALAIDPSAASAQATCTAQAVDALDKSGASQLKLADTYLEAGEWDEAAKAYVAAACSNSEAIARDARMGLAKALKARDAGRLGLRKYLPEPFSHWYPIDYAVYAVGIFALAVLVYGILSFMGGPFARLILKRSRSSANWRVSISGTAKEPQRSMAFDEFVVTMRELRVNRIETRELIALGKTGGRLFAPFPVADLLGSKLEIQGIDVSQVAKAIQVVLDYFSYRFEVRIDDDDGSAYVCAYLRWGGLTEKTWQIPTIEDDTNFEYREIGRRLAYSVFGDGLVRQ